MDLDARAYRCFIEVAEEKSFTRAAAKLNVSQPALSGQIRELERRLGFELFKRTSRRVELTNHGSTFLPYAIRLVSETDIVNRAAREIQSNELRVGAALHTELIPERLRLVESFLAMHPNIPITVQNDQHVRVMTGLARRQLEVVLSLEPGSNADHKQYETIRGDANKGLERLILSEKPIDLLMSPRHPLAVFRVIPITALRAVPIVIPNRFYGVALAEAITYRLQELGAIPLRAPEGHAIAITRYAQTEGVVAVDVHRIRHGVAAIERRRVENLGLSTMLVLSREVGVQRPAAELFWEHARNYSATEI